MKLLENDEVVELNDKNRALLQEALKLYIEEQEDCAICFDVPTDPVITHCKHVFCRPCIAKAIQIQGKCPMCRNSLNEDCLLDPPPEVGFDDVNFDGETQSSKTEAMLQIVRATIKKPGSKVIIFSQWTSFLNVVQSQLVSADIRYTRIDGSMTADKRDRAIDALENDEETRVMLASLAVCSVGLNLVAADTVILSDSCKLTLLFRVHETPFLTSNRVGSCHRGPSHRPRPPSRSDTRDYHLAPGHGEHRRGACPRHSAREA